MPILIESIKEWDRLAIAAKFDEDELWYRARILTEYSKNLNQLVIEFVDYGNRQTVSIEACIFLSEKFAKVLPNAVNCNGIAYLEGIDETLVKNLICHFKVNSIY